MIPLHLRISLVMAAAIALSVLVFVLLTWLKIENMLDDLAKSGGPGMAAAAALTGHHMLNAMLSLALPCIAGLLLPALIGCRLIFRPLRRILREAERVLDEGPAPAMPAGLGGELQEFGLRLRQADNQARSRSP